MRASACLLITLLLGVSVGAVGGDAPTVQQRDRESCGKQTLIATVFGEPLYLEQVTPATNIEIKRKELPPGKFDNWLREYRGMGTYRNIWSAVLRRYVQREKISVTDEELAAIAESVDRRLKSAPEPKDTTFSPAERKGIMVAWQRASLMDWKVCKSLHEKHGGRVGIGSLGAWTAFDGQNALLREHHKVGDIKFDHAEFEDAFWQHTKIKNFADAYPTGERLKTLLATPPYLQD